MAAITTGPPPASASIRTHFAVSSGFSTCVTAWLIGIAVHHNDRNPRFGILAELGHVELVCRSTAIPDLIEGATAFAAHERQLWRGVRPRLCRVGHVRRHQQDRSERVVIAQLNVARSVVGLE